MLFNNFCENNNNPSHYEIKIDSYKDFNEERGSPNLLFLPDKNYIFACSGFCSKSCEYSNISRKSLTTTASLNKSRENACMAYINERYIYIIGSFNLKKENKEGVYLEDIEYFDIKYVRKGWTIINYINNAGYNMALSSSGVIPISNDIFLICGGNDGKDYKDNVYKIDCFDFKKPIVEGIQSLPNKTIFTHYMFYEIQKSFFNIDITLF